MPQAPKRPCTHPGCPKLTDGGLCEEHRQQRQREYDAKRGSAASRGYGRRWQKASRLFLREHPLCMKCSAPMDPVIAEEVDHIIPHKGDMIKFWDVSNWQALCKSCHSAKTFAESKL